MKVFKSMSKIGLAVAMLATFGAPAAVADVSSKAQFHHGATLHKAKHGGFKGGRGFRGSRGFKSSRGFRSSRGFSGGRGFNSSRGFKTSRGFKGNSFRHSGFRGSNFKGNGFNRGFGHKGFKSNSFKGRGFNNGFAHKGFNNRKFGHNGFNNGFKSKAFVGSNGFHAKRGVGKGVVVNKSVVVKNVHSPYAVGGFYGFGTKTVYISDHKRFGLYAPPRGYRWVHDRGSNDAILASAATGAIIGLAVGALIAS